MERKDEVAVKRFFKVMIPGFQHKLILPPAMSKEVGQENSRRATLQSRLGIWKISLCSNSVNENDDDFICFNQGWPQFVDCHALRVGDFLYFIHTGNLHFHVYVFDPTACEKEFRDKLMKEKEKEKETTEALNLTNHPKNSRREEAENPIPYFEKKMVPSSSTKWIKIHIPVEFMRSNNLGLRTSVTLVGENGR